MIHYKIETTIGDVAISFSDGETLEKLTIFGPKLIVSKVVGGLGEEDEHNAWVTEKDLETVPKMMYTLVEVLKVAGRYTPELKIDEIESSAITFEVLGKLADRVMEINIKDAVKKLEEEMKNDNNVETFDTLVEPKITKDNDHYILKFRISLEGCWYSESKVKIYKDKIVANLSEAYEGGDMWHFIETKSYTIQKLQSELYGKKEHEPTV